MSLYNDWLSRFMLLMQNGMNGLHLASKEGHINVVLELLARAASVDSSTKVSYKQICTRGAHKVRKL